jgi:dipeptidyl-peptidase-4
MIVFTQSDTCRPQENPSGYDENSPNHVDKLKGKFLLIHGSGDDNVHLQNSMQMMEALIQANKQFDSQIYPIKITEFMVVTLDSVVQDD